MAAISPHRRLRWTWLLVGALVATTAQARLYRWVDEAGMVHYTDRLPPAQVDRGHAEMSDKGIVVGTTSPAKPPEELQREEELKRLREAAERAKQQQEAADQVLLRTFRSADDMIMTRDGKLATVDVMALITRGNIRRQHDWLRGLRADAADLERAGKPIPAQLSDRILNAENAIRESYASIVEREQQKQEIRASFANDLERFRELKGMPEIAEPRDDAPGIPLKNLVPCADAGACDRLWARAVAFVRRHANTPIQAAGPNILITAQPEKPQDISLTLSRIQDKRGPGSLLFLDAQCMPESGTDTSCTSAQAQSILDGFSDATLGIGTDG